MNKIIILLLFVTLFSCTREVKIEEEPDDFLKIPEYSQESVEKSNHYTPMPQNAIRFDSNDSTYWYVIINENRKGGGKISWHGTVALTTPYFDFTEAIKQFEGIKNKSYFEFILQIHKESNQTFDNYNEGYE
jgi:hypothetical protein